MGAEKETGHADAPETSVLVVGYQSLGYIARCLRGAIESTRGERCEILFIDCSNDGSVEFVRSEFPQIRTLDFEGNLGFGRGNNRLAAEARGRRFLLLNPDAFACRDELAQLIRLARIHPEAGAWGGAAMDVDGKVDPICGDRPPSLTKALLAALGAQSLTRAPRTRGVREAGVLSGSFMMVDADAWRMTGGFDPRFFLYAEELDLCKRIRDLGRKLVFDPSCTILHDTGGGQRHTPARLVNRARGNATYMRKHWGPLAAEIGCWIQVLHAAVRIARISLRSWRGVDERLRNQRDAWSAVLLRRDEWWLGW